MIRVLLVDDQVLFIESLKIVLENLADDLEIIGLASGGREAVRMAEEFHPDVILMDVSMPDLDGISATEKIKKILPDTNIIILTTFEEKEKVRQAVKLGINGYLLKNIKPELLIQYIHLSAGGGVFMSSEVIDRLCREKGAQREEEGDPSDFLFSLTRREKEILEYISQGLTNPEIAEKIHVGSQTIRNYISVIYSKLNVSNRMEAIKKIRKL